MCVVFFFQAEDGIRVLVRSRGLGDVYKRQLLFTASPTPPILSSPTMNVSPMPVPLLLTSLLMQPVELTLLLLLTLVPSLLTKFPMQFLQLLTHILPTPVSTFQTLPK